METSTSTLDRIKGNIDELPTLPAVTTHIIQMVQDLETSAEDVSAVIRKDPSLTAKVLKLVNSPFYGYSGRIATVSEAVVILGFNTVKNIVISASVFEVFKEENPYRIDRLGLWEHSVATGLAAEMAAENSDFPRPAEAMTGGILHSIGKIVIDLFFQDEIDEILRFSRINECSMLEAEQEVLGVGHPRIGYMLSRRWKLPESIQCAVGYYHEPLEAPDECRDIALHVHLGDVLAQTKNIGWTGNRAVPELRPEIAENLGLEKSTVQSILEDLNEMMEEAVPYLDMSVKKVS